MDTRRLAAFIKVVDLGSVTRAASVLNIAQPALSQQIIGLENEFRVQLLNRSTRGVTPTAAGDVLYRYARRIIRQVEEARRSVQDLDGALTGTVSVGLAGWSSVSLLGQKLIAEVRATYPGIRLQICDTFLIRLSEMVLKGQLDMAVIYGDRPARGLTYTPVGTERFWFVAPPEVLPQQAEPLCNDLLACQPFVLPTRESFARAMVEAACDRAGRMPNVTAEVFSYDNLISALQAGCGGTVLPRPVGEMLAERTPLVLHELEDDMEMPLSVCIPDSSGLSDAAYAVYGILERLLREDAEAAPVRSVTPPQRSRHDSAAQNPVSRSMATRSTSVSAA